MLSQKFGFFPNINLDSFLLTIPTQFKEGQTLLGGPKFHSGFP